MGLAKDANGFNIPTPTAGWQDGFRTSAPATNTTMIIFVSDVSGSDATSSTEGSKATPYKTIAKALTRTGHTDGPRPNSPDWILLATGETWTNQKGPDYFGRGLNEQNRMVFSSYDKTANISAPNNPPIPNPTTGVVARPIIKVPGGDPWAIGMAYMQAYTAIIGIDFYDYTRDTVANPANANNIPANAGMGIWNPNDPGYVLIEDCIIRWFAVGITGDAYSSNSQMSIRRNIIINNWGDKYGIGSWQIGPNFLIEENLVDMNGWDPIGQPQGASLNHNYYLSGNNSLVPGVGDDISLSDLFMRGNISTNCMFQDNNRCGGTLSNNLWQVGGTGGTNYGPNNPAIVNLIENEVWIGGFIAASGAWSDRCIELAADFGPDEHTGYYANGVPGIQHVNINNCIFTQPGPSVAAGAIIIGDQHSWGNLVTVNNCKCWKFATAVVVSGATYTDAGGNLATSNATTALGFGWTHPDRTPPTYMAEVIHDGSTWADFTRRCRLQSRRNWNPLLMAESVNDYIRQGFNVPMVGSAYASSTGAIFLGPLPSTGTVGVGYSGSVAASGGTPPYTYSLRSGSLPTGLNPLNTATGAVTGTPTVAGTYNFTIRATDSTIVAFTDQAYTITIAPSGGGGTTVSATGTAAGHSAASATTASIGGPTYHTVRLQVS